jgi:hypothetical protein
MSNTSKHNAERAGEGGYLTEHETLALAEITRASQGLPDGWGLFFVKPSIDYLSYQGNASVMNTARGMICLGATATTNLGTAPNSSPQLLQQEATPGAGTQPAPKRSISEATRKKLRAAARKGARRRQAQTEAAAGAGA